MKIFINFFDHGTINTFEILFCLKTSTISTYNDSILTNVSISDELVNEFKDILKKYYLNKLESRLIW